MYKLELNKTYNLTTIEKTITDLHVKVVGIVNYEEALKLGFDINVLALNEKVLTTDANSYLPNLTYYKCESISYNNEIIVVWPEIIDSNLTNIISESYLYTANITASLDTSSNINTILSQISDSALADHNINIEFRLIGSTDINDTTVELEQKIEKYESILESLNSLYTLLPTLDRISDGDVAKSVNSIQDTLDVISDKLTTISAGLI